MKKKIVQDLKLLGIIFSIIWILSFLLELYIEGSFSNLIDKFSGKDGRFFFVLMNLAIIIATFYITKDSLVSIIEEDEETEEMLYTKDEMRKAFDEGRTTVLESENIVQGNGRFENLIKTIDEEFA